MHADPAKKASQDRVSLLLDKLQASGKAQRMVAQKLEIPNQYLTDYRQGRRKINTQIARRLAEVFGEEFGMDGDWLLGHGAAAATESESKVAREISQASDAALLEVKAHVQHLSVAHTASVVPLADLLAVFPHPIEGDPRMHPKWSGHVIQVSPEHRSRLQLAKLPYLLCFGADDHQNRVQEGDLLLMSQAPPLQSAGIKTVIQVIRHGRAMYLARRGTSGWIRLAKGAPKIPFSEATVHGHALGIFWGGLV